MDRGLGDDLRSIRQYHRAAAQRCIDAGPREVQRPCSCAAILTCWPSVSICLPFRQPWATDEEYRRRVLKTAGSRPTDGLLQAASSRQNSCTSVGHEEWPAVLSLANCCERFSRSSALERARSANFAQETKGFSPFSRNGRRKLSRRESSHCLITLKIRYSVLSPRT